MQGAELYIWYTTFLCSIYDTVEKAVTACLIAYEITKEYKTYLNE